jgi:hypothetical protein
MAAEFSDEDAVGFVRASGERTRRRRKRRRRAEDSANGRFPGQPAGSAYNILFPGPGARVNQCALELQATAQEPVTATTVRSLQILVRELAGLIRNPEAQTPNYNPFYAEIAQIHRGLRSALETWQLSVTCIPAARERLREIFHGQAGRVGKSIYTAGVPENPQTLRDMVRANVRADEPLVLSLEDASCCVCSGTVRPTSDGPVESVARDREFLVPRLDGPSCQQRPAPGHEECTENPDRLCVCGSWAAGRLVLHVDCLADLLWDLYVTRYRSNSVPGPADKARDVPYAPCPVCRGRLCLRRLSLATVW